MLLDKYMKLSEPQFSTYANKNIISTSRGMMKESELKMLKMPC